MRKDVKLGMAIGGGLIAILVGYLLFAPPSNNNKKGTQLAGGGNPSIIDTAGPGDLTGGAESAPQQGGPAADPRATGTAKGPDTRQVETPVKGEEKPKPAGDQWTATLQKGKLPPVAKERDVAKAETPTGETSKPASEPKSETVARHETPGGGEQPPRFLSNPNDAWGGGVSTDAALGSPRPHAGSSLVSGAAETPAGGGGTHVVKAGETLSSIAQSAYGSAAYFPHILRANPNINPNNLKLGSVLKMPSVGEVKVTAASEHSTSAAPTAVAEAKIDTTKQYRVQQGDSLYKIAVKLYGKSSYVDRIYEKNKAAIGPDQKRLKLGMVLELPEKTAIAAAAPSDSTESSLSDSGTPDQAK
jgi:nucleoid-associated protein YgaU